MRALVRETSDTSLLERLGAELVVGELEDPASLMRAVPGTDVVLHMGAVTRARDEAGYARANEAGTRAVVDAVMAAEPRPRRLVYMSSLAAAGPSLDGRPVQVGDTPRPLTAYGRSKLAGEVACEAMTRDVELTILRASAVYGPRDRDLFHFFRLAKRGILPIPMGPPRPLQLIHVTDLAEAVVKAATVPEARGTVHVAERAAYAWEDVARKVAEAVGKRAYAVRIPEGAVRLAAGVSETLSRWAGASSIFNSDKARELLAPGWLCETDAARELLGFEAAIPLAEGLRSTARWYSEEGWL
jgi:nucleoside-diphosphate-sugar epimerase